MMCDAYADSSPLLFLWMVAPGGKGKEPRGQDSSCFGVEERSIQLVSDSVFPVEKERGYNVLDSDPIPCPRT